MLYLINFIDFCKYLLILKFMPACSNNLNRDDKRLQKLKNAEKHPIGIFYSCRGLLVAGDRILLVWENVSVCLSQTPTRGGSPLNEKTCRQMVHQPIKWSKDSGNLEKSLLWRNKEGKPGFKGSPPSTPQAVLHWKPTQFYFTTWAQEHFCQ